MHEPRVEMGVKSVIPTFTGKKFDIFRPKAELVEILDIAHGLSQECRYAAQASRFYSVAEHSVAVSRWAETLASKAGHPYSVTNRIALWGLIHDASEAYGLRDLPPPIVSNAPWGAAYKLSHSVVMKAVCERFALQSAMPGEVVEADIRMVTTEWKTLIHESIPYSFYKEKEPEPFPMKIDCLAPVDAKALFLLRFNHLTR